MRNASEILSITPLFQRLSKYNRAMASSPGGLKLPKAKDRVTIEEPWSPRSGASQPHMLTDSVLDDIKLVLLRTCESRSYDDILLLKSSLGKTDFMKKSLANSAPRLLDEMYRNAILESYEQDDNIFTQGDVGEKVYIILKGQVELKVKASFDVGDGTTEVRDKLLDTLATGQVFGERALDVSEPRSTSARAVHATDLIVFTKNDYLNIKKAMDIGTDKDKINIPAGTKEFVLAVLSQPRHRRSHEEIVSVASYLERRIPFFQKFHSEARLELCRVLDVLVLWGQHVLFKQGGVGQAFYIILSGTVDVYVNLNLDTKQNGTTRRTSVGSSPEGYGDKGTSYVVDSLLVDLKRL